MKGVSGLQHCYKGQPGVGSADIPAALCSDCQTLAPAGETLLQVSPSSYSQSQRGLWSQQQASALHRLKASDLDTMATVLFYLGATFWLPRCSLLNFQTLPPVPQIPRARSLFVVVP